MLFRFINYVSPTWYFNLVPKITDLPYWVDYNLLSEEEKVLISYDTSYSSDAISRLDAAYQAWHKGIIKTDMAFVLQTDIVKPLLIDEYHFIRKYYKSLWSVYVLIIRLFTLHNPLNEIKAFYKNRNIKKFDLYKVVNHYPQYNNFQSSLLLSSPFISVIIPTLNRYIYLDDVLKDLEQQDYKNFEVIVIDQSTPYMADFYKDRNLKMQVIQQPEKALWLARNIGIKQSKGDFLLFYDDDSRIEPDWIQQHIKTLDFFGADISSGVSISVVGAAVPFSYSFFKWSDQIDTGNFLIRKNVFNTTGLFDRQFERQRMGDGEFGLRCYLYGFKNISNPFAKRIHLKVSEGGLRQLGSWDGFRPKKILSPRPIPSVNYFIRKYFGTPNAICNLIINVPPSLMPYKFKRNKLALAFGSLVFLILMPILMVPVIKSWRRSSLMLEEKSKIEFI
jgi:glycosyltransferase involved in cell wall biosynthesis